MQLEDHWRIGLGVTYRDHTEEALEYELGRHRLVRVWST